MQIDLESTSSPSWKQSLFLNASTFSNLWEGSIPKAYGQMKAVARGTGFAMLQVNDGGRILLILVALLFEFEFSQPGFVQSNNV